MKPAFTGSFSSVITSAQAAHTMETDNGPITMQTFYIIIGAVVCVASVLTCLVACLVFLIRVGWRKQKNCRSSTFQQSVNMVQVLPPIQNLVELNGSTCPTKGK